MNDDVSRHPVPRSLGPRLEREGCVPAPSESRGGGQCTAPRSTCERYPLSFAQQRLWFVAQLEPDSPAYHISHAVRLLGPLHHDALCASLDALVARHAVLRGTITVAEDGPYQRIHPVGFCSAEDTGRAHCLHPWSVRDVFDLAGEDPARRDGEAHRLINESVRRPFDLRHELPFRARLLRLGDRDHVLILTMHHIASDGWSMGIVLRELSLLYRAFVSGQPSALPALPVEYCDYAAWQRDQLGGAELERQQAYWRQVLGGAPPLLELPGARRRSMSSLGDRQTAWMENRLVSAARELGRRERATLFMTLLAVFQTLLLRYTRQTDLCVGTPYFGRSRKEFEGLVGFFVNTLVLRTDLSGNPTFRQLLCRVREVCLGAFEHSELPFEKVVESVGAARDRGSPPWVQAMFVLEDEMGSLSLPDISANVIAVDTGTAKFDLTLFLVSAADGMRMSLEYRRGLLDAAGACRMLGHFQTLLEGAVAQPDRCVADLPILSSAERHRMVYEWNETAVPYPRDLCIHQLFEIQAARTPEAIAIVFGDEQVSYGELNIRANRLARMLQSHGVLPEAVVAICMPRSVEMIVAVLAVLKAGGAYLPLDPAAPPQRSAFMMREAGATLVLTESHRGTAPDGEPGQVIRVDRDGAAMAQYGAENVPNQAAPDSLACVMFTSGSTGHPKGVGVMHRGVVRLVRGANYVAIAASDVFLQFAPLAFDASSFEIWGSLLNGARLVVAAPQLPGLRELGRTIEQCGVTVLWLTAALFEEMVDASLESLGGVRQLLAGGDVLSPTHARKFLARHKHCRLVNGYGPTENTTFSCCHVMCDADEVRDPVPIGRPISNTSVYVLDAGLNPVPPGAVGELFVGGDGLARGYVNRAALTAERFVANPFCAEPGSRLYRTGDLARYLDDGTVEFLGRVDRQVKLRGHRVEPAEVEAALGRHPAVSRCVVTVCGDGMDRCLAGYVVAREPARPSVLELRQFLATQLPEYMVPRTIQFLDALPLTPNGKLDRAGLPPASQARADLPISDDGPSNVIERRLARIWRDLLGLKRVGVGDSFFDLGGHSLSAVRLMVQIERDLEQSLPLASLFTSPTIRQLAALICEAPAPLHQGGITMLQGPGVGPPLFCVSGAGGHNFVFRQLAPYLGSHQPVYGLQYPGLDGRREPLGTVEELATVFGRHIRSVQPDGPYYLCGFSFGGLVAFETARRLVADGHHVELLALCDSFASSLLHDGQRQRKRVREAATAAGESPLLRWLEQVRRANRQAAQRYVPAPYSGDALLVRVLRRDRQGYATDPCNGWGRLVAGGVEVHVIGGKHKQMFREPGVRHLADVLRARLRPGSRKPGQLE